MLQFDTTKSSMLTTTSEPSNTQVDGSFVDALPGLQSAIRVFSTERKWTAFHLPRNLLLALLGELGELAELLQWKPDSEQKLSLQEHDKLGQEIADVSIYLIRLADVCGVSLKDAMDQVVESE
jgi:dCTP diphosphatase